MNTPLALGMMSFGEKLIIFYVNTTEGKTKSYAIDVRIHELHGVQPEDILPAQPVAAHGPAPSGVFSGERYSGARYSPPQHVYYRPPQHVYYRRSEHAHGASRTVTGYLGFAGYRLLRVGLTERCLDGS